MSTQTSWTTVRGRIRTAMMTLLPIAIASTLQPALTAQTVSFANAQTTVGSGFLVPRGVAVDAAGNVFVADSRNRRVVKVSATGVQTTLLANMYEPEGVAVDKDGNLFISDPPTGKVLEISADNVQTTLLAGLNYPEGLATDSSGNVYIADSNNARVLKLAPGSAPATIGKDMTAPYGVSVDRAGNVFISDPAGSQLIEVSSNGTQSTLAFRRSLLFAYAVTLDAEGNLFFPDYLAGRVIKRAANGAETTVVEGGLKGPYGLAVDGNGSLFIADSGNNRVVKVGFKAADFGPAGVCPSGQSSSAPCSKTITLNYNITGSGTLGVPMVLTQGVPNLDFKLADGNTCTGAVTAGTTCSVNVTFAPLALGVRLGAVELTDTSGNIVATTPISGQGEGPAIGFGAPAQSTLDSALNMPFNMPFGAVKDAAGNIFIADQGNNRVVKLAPGGAQSTVGLGLLQPLGVAVDGAGNVYIADYGNNRVLKVSPGGNQTTVGSGLNQPYGVALDGSGNVFIVDIGFNRVLKVSSEGIQSEIATGSQFTAVAADAAGNTFLVDFSNSSVIKVAADGGKTIIATGLYSPRGVAVAASGRVYVVTANSIVEIARDGTQTPILQGLFFPAGVTTDGEGNLLLADVQNNRILYLARSQPARLNFAPTYVGSASSDGRKTVIVQNIGTERLNAVAPGISTDSNFPQVSNAENPSNCPSTFSLEPGASCNLSISFVPQTDGTVQGSVVLTDNALNAASAAQTIPLSGTGLPVYPSTTTVSDVAGQYSDAVTLTARIASAVTNFTGSLQFQVAGANVCSASVTGPGTYTCSYTITQKPESFGITATLTSAIPSVKSSAGSATLTVTKEDTTFVPSVGNPTMVQVNSPGGAADLVTLKGTLQQATDGSLGDINNGIGIVALVPTVGGAADIYCMPTNTNGAITAVCPNAPVNGYRVQWAIGGEYYRGTTVNTTLVVYDPSLASPKGNGSISNNGVAADFSVNAKYQKSMLSGSFSYVEHRTTGDVTVNGVTLSSMSVVGTAAVIYGQATVNGVAGYTFELIIVDNGSQATNRDMFGLKVSGGTLAPPISFAPLVIKSGDIQVR